MEKRFDGIAFSRKELYDMLTEKSVSKIADELGLNAKTLTQEIDANHIPRIFPADWTRISMGKEVERAPLKGDPDTIVFVPYPDNDSETNSSAEEFTYPVMPASWPNKKQKSKKKAKKARPKTEVSPYTKNLQKKIEEYDQQIPLYQLIGVDPNEEQYRRISLLELDLSVRAMNGLVRENINTLHDILQLSIGDLFQIRNLGITSIDDIITACKRFCIKHAKQQAKKAEEIKKALPVESASSDNSLFVKLMMEFYKLNQTGQEVAVETLKGLTTIDRFRTIQPDK